LQSDLSLCNIVLRMMQSATCEEMKRFLAIVENSSGPPKEVLLAMFDLSVLTLAAASSGQHYVASRM
jgi:hypothetical protein